MLSWIKMSLCTLI